MMIGAGSDWHEPAQCVLDDWAKEATRGLVISPDIDGLTSACIIASAYPDAKIVGIYNLRHVVLLDGATAPDAARALWVDHDISAPGVRCIGQHLVHHRATNSLPLRHAVSFNPNAWALQAHDTSFKGLNGNRRDKFPFGTVHLFADLLEVDDPSDADLVALLAHCDGTWFVAQCYPHNVEIWRDLMFPGSVMMDVLGPSYPSSETRVRTHSRLVDGLIAAGVRKSASNSSHAKNLPDSLRRLTGHQGVGTPLRAADPQPYIDKYLGLLRFVGDIVGATPQSGTRATSVITGETHKQYPDQIVDFDQMMVSEKVFSHAFTFYNTISYTTGIDLSA
jgi:hypothetical protein